ncbi:Tetraspanin-7 [Senna tora]|uniref:Tetraspanin-7 n=1 Tax=Senna tora TaxID=362788 RepID=A0A834W280_9FABA|nr:Tetraspanin-7 [Senna tora]
MEKIENANNAIISKYMKKRYIQRQPVELQQAPMSPISERRKMQIPNMSTGFSNHLSQSSGLFPNQSAESIIGTETRSDAKFSSRIKLLLSRNISDHPIIHRFDDRKSESENLSTEIATRDTKKKKKPETQLWGEDKEFSDFLMAPTREQIKTNYFKSSSIVLII